MQMCKSAHYLGGTPFFPESGFDKIELYFTDLILLTDERKYNH
jgi:hypothetical protein